MYRFWGGVTIATLLVALSASACMPVMPSERELTAQQLALNQKEANKTSDPDQKAFWNEATDCARKNKVTMQDVALTAKAPYSECTLAVTNRHIAELEARAATTRDQATRDRALKLVACMEILKGGQGFPYKSFDECIERTPLRARDAEAIASSGDYAEAEKAGTSKAWIAFLAKHRDDKRSPDIAKRVLASAADAPSDEQGRLDDELATAYPLALRDMPADRRLLLVGPPGLRVRDLKKMADAKVANSIVLARIRASKEPYKSFDGDELGTLKSFGLSDDAVTAMIEVSSKLEDKKKDDEERKALRDELSALKKLVESKKGEQSSGVTVQTKEGPMDALASCAKRLAAMNLCEKLPFPGSTLCQSATESEFPCPQK